MFPKFWAEDTANKQARRIAAKTFILAIVGQNFRGYEEFELNSAVD